MKNIENDNDVSTFIDYYEEKVYERYCEIYPEQITSDTMLEDFGEELIDFVRDYMEDDFIEWSEKNNIKKGETGKEN